MSRHLNQVLLVGNLADDPEVRTVGQQGSVLSKFTVATNEEYTTKSGDQVEKTQWTRCVAWNGTAEGSESLKKGELVAVIGKIQTRKWDNNGIPTYTTEVIVDSVSKITVAQKGQRPRGNSSKPTGPPQGGPPQGGPPQGGPPVNPTNGGWPFKDMTNDVAGPTPDSQGYSMVHHNALWLCCAWYDPKDPEQGGDLLSLNADGNWVKQGSVPEIANKF